MRVSAALATTVALAAVGVAPAAHARADEVVTCDRFEADSPAHPDDAESIPLKLMGVPAAQRAVPGDRPGQGVVVAVLDSGISTAEGQIPVLPDKPFSTPVQDWHGTAVAGLIAGQPRKDGSPVGIAPGAGIVDVRVFETTADNVVQVNSQAVVDGLNWVADRADTLNIKVVNMSLSLSPNPQLKAALHRVDRADIVVVAASGNRPTEGSDPLWDKFGEGGTQTGLGEDAGGQVFPAAYPHVVAVNATADADTEVTDLSSVVLPNSDTDVAAPTFDAVSVGLNGSNCRLQKTATSWSAAEVSGVVALLRARFPRERAPQIVARLLQTASGAMDAPTQFQGAGVVQPLAALTRPLHPDRSGDLSMSTAVENGDRRATAPEPEADVLAATREHAVWWGLLGGGALLLALLLRPVLARRRD
ncbi:MAG: peptidase and in, kexin, sedolisin [Nocardioides sp.]|nr:peptidase and in, kexin, sedolisin [Nocardioides sp.]